MSVFAKGPAGVYDTELVVLLGTMLLQTPAFAALVNNQSSLSALVSSGGSLAASFDATFNSVLGVIPGTTALNRLKADASNATHARLGKILQDIVTESSKFSDLKTVLGIANPAYNECDMTSSELVQLLEAARIIGMRR